jgi:hypothetical protein
MNPGEQFSLLDKFLASGPNSRNRFLLDRLYKQILWTAFSDLEEEQFRPRLRILYAILSIPSALSVQTIAQLDSAFSENLVEIVVSNLHAVLYIQGNKIYSYHSSFPDFFFDSKRSSLKDQEAGGGWLWQGCSVGLHAETGKIDPPKFYLTRLKALISGCDRDDREATSNRHEETKLQTPPD